MNIKQNPPLQTYVLVDKYTGEFYCGSGLTHSSLFYAKTWDKLSAARGARTRYINDVIRQYYSYSDNACVIPARLEIKSLVIFEYELNDR